MKNLFCFLLLGFCIESAAAQTYPFRNPNLTVDERLDDLVGRMTLEEKIDLLAGYRDFYLHPCPRLGIEAFKMADGPLGIASWGLFGRATAFPSALSLAASWDTVLAYRVGQIYAQEWRARGIHFMLAPGVNLYRASKGARNFEYYGEDPFLASAMVVPFIQGVQQGGVAATVKHFAGNDQEFDRYTVSTEADERTLRELYFPPFRAAVQKAGVKAVMTGYNPLGGTYCTQNDWLNNQILKGEWGFKGVLMSDWACTYSPVGAANGGLDLEMGSKSCFNREQLIPLLESGQVTQATIDDKVRRIYGTCLAMGFFDRPQQDTLVPVFNAQANKLALEAAEQGIILLKNQAHTLPLRSPKTIAVIGPTANPGTVNDRAHTPNGIVYGGGGSSKVNPWYVIDDLQGILQEFPGAEVRYDPGISNRFKANLFRRGGFLTPDGRTGLRGRYVRIADGEAASAQVLAEQAKAAGRAEAPTALPASDSAAIERIDRTIDFEWWGKPHNNEALGAEYAVRWDGFIEAEATDTLLFFVDAQGGYRLWLDGRLAVDALQSQSFCFGSASLGVEKGQKVAVVLEYRNQRSSPSEIRFGYAYGREIDFSPALRLARTADAVVFCGGMDGAIELEGRDRPFELPYGQDRLIEQLCAVNPNTVVVLHAGGGVDMSRWADRAAAIVHALYAGQEGGRALARILSGRVNPSAKLPFTIERRWEDSPAAGNYDETRREKKVYYREGIFAGYRGYEQLGIAPLFPFGYGLSYTSFEYSDLRIEAVDKKAHRYRVSFTLTNTGARSGAEVAQVYVSDPKSSEPRPPKELKGFSRHELAPGESVRASVELDGEAFAFFSAKKGRWVVEPGAFEVVVGSSSADIRLRDRIEIK